jgi:hypothetical protein
VPGGITGPPGLRGSQIRRPGSPGWGVGTWLSSPSRKTIIVEMSDKNSRPDPKIRRPKLQNGMGRHVKGGRTPARAVISKLIKSFCIEKCYFTGIW